MIARRSLLLAAALCPWAEATQLTTEALKAGVFDPPRAAPEVALRGSDGRDFRLADYRGQVVLLVFGFTSCPAVCPTTLATLSQARGQLGTAAADVQVAFVTVDPERDDVPRLKTYVTAFDAAFVGATGDAAALERARKAFGATATKVPVGSGYAFDHTSSVFIIDRQGRLRGMMPFGRSPTDYVHDLRILLAAR